MPFLEGLLVLECLLPFFLAGDIGSLSGVELQLEDALLLECSSSDESEESPLNGVLRIWAACWMEKCDTNENVKLWHDYVCSILTELYFVSPRERP